MGDFNYNFFDPVLHSYVVHNKMMCFLIKTIIYDATRGLLDSISLTDVILCSNYLQLLEARMLCISE